jgi:hypothetical protein
MERKNRSDSTGEEQAMQAFATTPGERTLSRLLALLGILLFGWMLWYSSANTATHFISDWSVPLLVLASVAAALPLAKALGRYGGGRTFMVALLLLVAAPRIVWIAAVDTAPVSDFLDMHSAALSAAAGDLSFGENEYFSRWAYQLGFTFYEALAIKLFGSSLIVLKLLNVLFQAGTAVVLYKCAVRAFGETCGRAAALMYAVYVPNIIMCSVLTNQHISVFFYFLGLYVLIRKSFVGKYDWLLVGLCIGLGNLMRPLGSFFLIGVLAYAALFLLAPRIRERSWPALAAKCVGVLAVYWLVQQAASFALVQGGVTPYPLSNREPYWKFMIGLNPATNGGWSYDDTVYVLQYPPGEERNRVELELLKKRLEDKRQVGALFASKTKAMWGDEDSAPMWSLPDMDRPELVKRLVQTERIQYVLMAFFGLVAMTVIAWRGATGEASLFLLLLLGYAALHVVIEVQTRYRFDIWPCAIILQSFGIYALLGLFRRKGGV